MGSESEGSRPIVDAWRRRRVRWRTVRDVAASRFAVDARSLAALRVALGAILLVDLAHRWGSLERFYTDEGVYPLAVYERTFTEYNGFAVHAVSGEPWVQRALFLVAGAVAVALVLGYRTRLATALSIALLASLQARNPAVLNGGDRLLLVLLLVSLPAPLGERWSIDALRRGEARRTVRGVATVALLVQPIVVFTQNAVLKHRGDTWYEGEAVGIALANDEMTILLGNVLRDYSTLLEAANWLWIALLAGSPLLLLATRERLRSLFALGYVVAFAGMAATLSVGLFPLVLTASVLPFLAAPFWEALTRSRRWPDGDWVAARVEPLLGPPPEHRLRDALGPDRRESLASTVGSTRRSLWSILAALLLCWMLVFGAANAAGHDASGAVGGSLAQGQEWNLYAPNPSDSYGWSVVEAELEDGSTVDALGGGAVETDRPPDAARQYDGFRERKYLQTVRDSAGDGTDDAVADAYADWVCERASDRHDGAVERVTVSRFVQPSPVDGTYAEPSVRPVLERDC